MNPNNTLNPPATGGYLPYFYQAGLHELYPIPASNVLLSTPDSSPASSHSLHADVPLQTDDRTQTVEQIIAHGYFAVPSADPVTALIGDKKQTSWLGLDDVLKQVGQRRELCRQNIYELELGKCAALNSIYASEAYHGPPSDQQFESLHRRIQDLYQQQRDERVNMWRDVSRLRLGLPDSIQQYLSAHRKLGVLNDPLGDGE